MAAASSSTADVERANRLQRVAQTLDIGLVTVEEMAIVELYDIVLLCDDSGSMGTATRNAQGEPTGQTRFDELRDTVGMVVQLATALDADGISIVFFGRPRVDNVTSAEQVRAMFSDAPSCSTPLAKTAQRLFDEQAHKGPGAKPMLLVIATDGVPDEGVDKFYSTLAKRDTHNIAISILACTDDDNAVGYLNDIDNEIARVDVLDDYDSERAEVLKTGRPSYTRGDHAARLLLGPLSDRWDSMDEGSLKNGGMTKAHNHIAVTVHWARDLLSGDKNGLSDPYVKGHLVGVKKESKTRVIDKTLNPVWNERIIIPGPFTPTSVVQLDVYDKDMFGSDILGSATYNLNAFNGTNAIKQVLQLGGTGPKGAPATGTICVSFEWSDVMVGRHR